MERAMGRAARPSVRASRAQRSTVKLDTEIVADRIQRDYERGCRWAALALCGMFAVMALGAVVLGW